MDALLNRVSHLNAGVVHAVNFVASVIVLWAQPDKGFWYTEVRTGATLESSRVTYVAWIVPYFFAVSAIAHAVHYRYGSGDEKPHLRWFFVEYAISTPPIVFLTCVLSGLSGEWSASWLAVLFVVLMRTGHVQVTEGVSDDVKNYAREVGACLHVIMWFPIIGHFITAVSGDDADPPITVYFIIVALFVLFTSFGVVIELMHRGATMRSGSSGGLSISQTWRWLIVLSLVSKTLLGWLYIGGALRDRDDV